MCQHKRIRCTNCEYFCLDCGAKLEPPKQEEQPTKKSKKKS